MLSPLPSLQDSAPSGTTPADESASVILFPDVLPSLLYI